MVYLCYEENPIRKKNNIQDFDFFRFNLVVDCSMCFNASLCEGACILLSVFSTL
jgi:hypothetical protein